MNALYPRVADRAGHRCEYCHAPENIFNMLHEVEHILPSARGGADDEANLALACHACNLYKSDFVIGHDADTQTDTRLFHPRRDIWADHFRVDMATAAITGTTPIGRATVMRLQINRAAQLVARRLWIELRLFP